MSTLSKECLECDAEGMVDGVLCAACGGTKLVFRSVEEILANMKPTELQQTGALEAALRAKPSSVLEPVVVQELESPVIHLSNEEVEAGIAVEERRSYYEWLRKHWGELPPKYKLMGGIGVVLSVIGGFFVGC